MDEDRRAYYEYNSCLLEPWDGPASIAFTDGTKIGARARPQRSAALALHGDQGRLPGDGVGGRRAATRRPRTWCARDACSRAGSSSSTSSRAASSRTRRSRPIWSPAARTARWVETNRVKLSDLPRAQVDHHPNPETRFLRQQVFGYTSEDLRIVIAPMIRDGKEGDRIDGRGRRAGVPVRPPAAALPVLQAALRAGHEPGRSTRSSSAR